MKFGIIGAGKIGYGQNNISTNSHFFNYKKKNFFDLGFIVDTNNYKFRLLKKKFNKKVFKNIKDLKFINKVDVLSICVPPKKTLKVLSNLEKRNLIPNYVILEKPVANNIQDVVSIIKILKKKNVYVNLQRIFDKNFLNLIKKKNHSLVFHYTGGLYNNGIHILTLLIFKFGWPKEVKKIDNFNIDYKLKDPSYSFIINFKKFNATILGFDNIDYNKFDFEFISQDSNLILRSGGSIEIKEKICKFPSLQNYKINIPKKINHFKQINGLKYIMNSIINKEKPIYNALDLIYRAHLLIKKISNKNV
jgi:hypothetical protein